MPEEQRKVSVEAGVLSLLERKPDGLSAHELSEELSISKDEVSASLQLLNQSGAIEVRKVANSVNYYPLQTGTQKKVLIVEDDADINKLMELTIGKDYQIQKAFEGNEAMKMVREFRQDLIILDLMLPGMHGLEICGRVKADPELKNTVIVIVSAADAVKNRFSSIKYGADYYIRKPFNTRELRSLVNIFLKKKGKKFDPLVDLPDEKRLSKLIDDALTNNTNFELYNLRIHNLKGFESEYGESSRKMIVRLVSQILQDKVQEWESRNGFVGYIGEGEFVVGGGKNETETVLSEVSTEFERVQKFIYQSTGSQLKKAPFNIESLFDGDSQKTGDKIALQYDEIPFDKIIQKRNKILETKAPAGTQKTLNEYSYSELMQLVGSSNLDLKISGTPKGGVSISVSKGDGEENQQQ
ncbi:Chemotaxis protein CheY [Candidatus Gugararchaeum adminiculabundum]|nr:Chemotaxis protein CheY [Candidatus Gugararchaeum adminiculabundum]